MRRCPTSINSDAKKNSGADEPPVRGIVDEVEVDVFIADAATVVVVVVVVEVVVAVDCEFVPTAGAVVDGAEDEAEKGVVEDVELDDGAVVEFD